MKRKTAIFDFVNYRLVYDGNTYDVFVKFEGKFYDVGIGFTSFNKARELAKRELANSK